MKRAVHDIDIPVKKLYSGKVRDLFDLPGGNMLMVASDRISAFDYILPTPIPEKGAVLTKLSLFWFSYLKETINNHVVEASFDKFPEHLRALPVLEDRSIIVKKAERLPVECVVRGYLAGSGWKEYKVSGTVCNMALPAGLQQGSKLSEPIFTPATKAEQGDHDMNISVKELKNMIGTEMALLLEEKSINIYTKGIEYAEKQGIIIADTKFEFGINNGELILIDEVFTPDSSRFWEISKHKEGSSQESLDKQYIRDYLESTEWDKNSSPPALPDEVVAMTVKKYKQIYSVITGEAF